jgi:hypothetical protein
VVKGGSLICHPLRQLLHGLIQFIRCLRELLNCHRESDHLSSDVTLERLAALHPQGESGWGSAQPALVPEVEEGKEPSRQTTHNETRRHRRDHAGHRRPDTKNGE